MSGISRRQAFAGLGSISVGALVAACGDDDYAAEPTTSARDPASAGDGASSFDDAATCRQTAAETEGPFYFDVDKIRSEIREDREGVPLRLGVRVRVRDTAE
jgi:hypothetical protein